MDTPAVSASGKPYLAVRNEDLARETQARVITPCNSLELVPADRIASTPDHKLLTVEDVEGLPDLEWLIRDVLPYPAFCVLYGEPGSGKSFVALDIALSCASGRPWLGRVTKKIRILYLAAEGVLGFKNRLRAYSHRRELVAANVRFIASPLVITDPLAVQTLLACMNDEGFVPDLIIIDTLARVTVGMDENNAKDMGEAVAGFDELKRQTNATVLVIHHTTKNGGTERGSSALRGAADTMILCEKSNVTGLGVSLKCSKMKDGEPFPDILASLEKIVLPSGASSLIVGELLDALGPGSKVADIIVVILAEKYAVKGATYDELQRTFCTDSKKSKSTFDRTWRDLRHSTRVRGEEVGGKVRYFPANVSVTSVSNECQTQTQASVMSSTTVVDDTDTAGSAKDRSPDGCARATV